MQSEHLTYNASKKTFECHLENNNLETFLVIPRHPKNGEDPKTYDALSTLVFFKGEERPFQLHAKYSSDKDVLEFLFDGPVGYSYKMSLSLNPGAGEHYNFKVKKHGWTQKVDESSILYMPMEVCRTNAPIVHATKSVMMLPSFQGPSVSTVFLALRLKITVMKGDYISQRAVIREKEAEIERQKIENIARLRAEIAKQEAERKAIKDAKKKVHKDSEEDDDEAKKEAKKKANKDSEEDDEAKKKANKDSEEDDEAKKEAKEKANKDSEEDDDEAKKEAKKKANKDSEEDDEAKKKANKDSEEDDEAKKEAKEKANKDSEEDDDEAKKEAKKKANKDSEEEDEAKKEAKKKANKDSEKEDEAKKEAKKKADAKAKKEAEKKVMVMIDRKYEAFTEKKDEMEVSYIETIKFFNTQQSTGEVAFLEIKPSGSQFGGDSRSTSVSSRRSLTSASTVSIPPESETTSSSETASETSKRSGKLQAAGEKLRVSMELEIVKPPKSGEK